jgi:hypothetical protein
LVKAPFNEAAAKTVRFTGFAEEVPPPLVPQALTPSASINSSAETAR